MGGGCRRAAQAEGDGAALCRLTLALRRDLPPFAPHTAPRQAPLHPDAQEQPAPGRLPQGRTRVKQHHGVGALQINSQPAGARVEQVDKHIAAWAVKELRGIAVGEVAVMCVCVCVWWWCVGGGGWVVVGWVEAQQLTRAQGAKRAAAARARRGAKQAGRKWAHASTPMRATNPPERRCHQKAKRAVCSSLWREQRAPGGRGQPAASRCAAGRPAPHLDVDHALHPVGGPVQAGVLVAPQAKVVLQYVQLDVELRGSGRGPGKAAGGGSLARGSRRIGRAVLQPEPRGPPWPPCFAGLAASPPG